MHLFDSSKLGVKDKEKINTIVQPHGLMVMTYDRVRRRGDALLVTKHHNTILVHRVSPRTRTTGSQQPFQHREYIVGLGSCASAATVSVSSLISRHNPIASGHFPKARPWNFDGGGV